MSWLVEAVRLLAKGGYVMIPLIGCSVAAVAVLIERYYTIKKAQIDVSQVIRQAEDALYEGDPRRAQELAESQESPVARVIAAGLRSSHLGERCAERAMKEQGTREVSALSLRLGWLDTIITIAPLLGLLGTVTGMISAFGVIATTEGISTPTAITGGVAEALIATATGLAIAIFTLIGYNNLQERIKEIVVRMETHATAMMNVLADCGEGPGEAKRLSA